MRDRVIITALAVASMLSPTTRAQTPEPAPPETATPAASANPTPAPSPVTPTPAAAPESAPAFTEQSAPLRIAIAPVHGKEVDPRATVAVTDQLRATLTVLGADPLDTEATGAALAGLGAPFPPKPADLWRLTQSTGADFAVAASVRIEDGAYVVDLWIAARSGKGPYSSVIEADAPALRPALDARLRELIDEATAAERPEQAAREPSEKAIPAKPTAAFKPIRLAVQTEAALGLTDDFFYNHLFGGRFDYRFTRKVALGGYLGYVNLKGRDGRAHNVLPLAHVEYRTGLDRSDTVLLALRYAAGYLPSNGPFTRLSAGLAFQVSNDVDILVDLIAPTFWLTNDLPVVSANFAAELGFTP